MFPGGCRVNGHLVKSKIPETPVATGIFEMRPSLGSRALRKERSADLAEVGARALGRRFDTDGLDSPVTGLRWHTGPAMGDDDTPQEQPTPRDPTPITDRYREGGFEHGEKSSRDHLEESPRRQTPPPPPRRSRDDD